MSLSRHSAFSSWFSSCQLSAVSFRPRTLIPFPNRFPFPLSFQTTSAVRNLLLLPEIFPLRFAHSQVDACSLPLCSCPHNAISLVSSLRTSICPASPLRRPLHQELPEVRDSALPAAL